MSFWGYSISFVVMVILIITNFESFSLGNPGGASYAVFVSSVLILIFSLLSIYFFVRDRQMVSLRADKIFLYLCIGSAAIITTYLGVWGMIGLRTWM
jgi:hypothetical protein